MKFLNQIVSQMSFKFDVYVYDSMFVMFLWKHVRYFDFSSL